MWVVVDHRNVFRIATLPEVINIIDMGTDLCGLCDRQLDRLNGWWWSLDL